MGTPEFAVPSLDILVRNGYKAVGVVTATDKMGGRGLKQVIQPAVKQYAIKHGIPVLQPQNLKSPEFLEALRQLEGNLQVVVAFRMLPEAVWALPSYGTFNLHGSLLPRYRGAAPINWAVINGESETGVTTFFIKNEIDTGDIILQERMPVGENDTAGDVHDSMMLLGAETVLKTVRLIESGNVELQKQDHSMATKAPKLYHETCEIDFAQPTQKVHDFIRGLSPYPAAWCSLDGKELKILRTAKVLTPPSHPPGTFVSDNKNFLRAATLDGYLEIQELQLEGRRRMVVRDFLNGFSF
ncbi:MAG: methionyl-tRNA formyltransferase [Phaeodactylibacter sp.]|nr:methionyl-tRNA formyltransferase [Phaeodactylibacter sp.]MCB9275978.1 methionyl-tRNA formyltransferase [Lewinellaceae bacterium]